MIVTSYLFDAYLNCATKCWLRSRNESGTGNSYANWVTNRADSYRNNRIKRLMDGGSQDERVLEPSGIENLKNDTCRSAANIVAQAGNLQSRIHSRWSACCRKMATSPLSSFPFDSSQTTNLLRTTSCC